MKKKEISKNIFEIEYHHMNGNQWSKLHGIFPKVCSYYVMKIYVPREITFAIAEENISKP